MKTLVLKALNLTCRWNLQGGFFFPCKLIPLKKAEKSEKHPNQTKRYSLPAGGCNSATANFLVPGKASTRFPAQLASLTYTYY